MAIAAVQAYHTLYRSIPSSYSKVSKVDPPVSLSSFKSSVDDLIKQIPSLRLEPYDLASPTNAIPKRNSISYLDLSSTIEEDFSKALRLDSDKLDSDEEDFARILGLVPEEILADRVKQAARFVISFLKGKDHLLPKDTRFFFHSTICGKFKHSYVLGEGSYGRINIITLGSRLFACKQPRLDKGYFGEICKSLRKELKVLLKCHHPNIISLAAAKLLPTGALNLYLELADTNLNDFLWQQPNLCNRFIRVDPKQRRKILTEFAAGLTYLHGKKVIHLDLRPTNILLTSNLTVKIADFGYATLDNGSKTQYSKSMYTAPEALFFRNITTQYDVWSFGVIAFQMFKNDDPYPKHPGESNLAYRKRLFEFFYRGADNKTSALFKEESQWNPHDRVHFWRNLIGRCLEPFPNKRSSMREIHNDLVSLKESESHCSLM